MKKTIEIFLFSLIFSSSVSAIESFRHPTCDTYIHDFKVVYKWDKKLISRLRDHLKNKGFNLKSFSRAKRLSPGDFHVYLERTLTGKMYKECLMEIKILQAKSTTPQTTDTQMAKKQSNRKFPRQTFEGKERCQMALDDLFFTMNICKTR